MGRLQSAHFKMQEKERRKGYMQASNWKFARSATLKRTTGLIAHPKSSRPTANAPSGACQPPGSDSEGKIQTSESSTSLPSAQFIS